MTVERTPPSMMSARERAAEVTALLAQAILRLHATLPAFVPTEPAVRLGFSPERPLNLAVR